MCQEAINLRRNILFVEAPIHATQLLSDKQICLGQKFLPKSSGDLIVLVEEEPQPRWADKSGSLGPVGGTKSVPEETQDSQNSYSDLKQI